VRLSDLRIWQGWERVSFYRPAYMIHMPLQEAFF
jgi:hypothetical protein